MEEIERASRLRDHLLRGVIEFWARHALAEPRGGYFAQLARDGTPLGDVQHLPTCARIAAAFSIASRVAWSSRFLCASRRGIRYILEFFRDREEGGWFLEIEADGRIRSDAKLPAGHALVVEALAEHAIETEDGPERAAALAEWRWLRERLWDSRHGGFAEAMDRSGSIVRERKTLGTHLCALNALLALFRALPGEAAVRDEALELAALIASRARDRESGALLAWFRTDWTPVEEHGAPVVSFGHAFEGALTFFRAARILKEPGLAGIGGEILTCTRACALDPQRGLCRYLGTPAGVAWAPEAPGWAQAMAVGALAAGGRILGREEWLRDALDLADRAIAAFHDPEHGGWYGVLRPDGALETTNKGGFGHDPYPVAQGFAQAILALEGGGARAPRQEESLESSFHLG